MHLASGPARPVLAGPVFNVQAFKTAHAQSTHVDGTSRKAWSRGGADPRRRSTQGDRLWTEGYGDAQLRGVQVGRREQFW